MIDIDHFKEVNDTYDHITGDLVLQLVAATIDKHLRGDMDVVIPIEESNNSDKKEQGNNDTHKSVASRYGGEEVLIVLPGTAEKDAVQIAERLRVAVENTKVYPNEDSENPIKVTVSIGVANTKSDPRDTPIDFIRVADQYLYMAKGEGRNKVISHKSAESLKKIKETAK